jgi:hypothetical protein
VDDLAVTLGLLAVEHARKHPSAIGWLILLGVFCTLITFCVGVWGRRQSAEKRALLSRFFLGRGLIKLCSAIGVDPVRVVDALVDIWKGLVNFVARRLGKEQPYTPEVRAIVTSAKGEPVETALVVPASQRVVSTVPASEAALEEARAEAERERREATLREGDRVR